MLPAKDQSKARLRAELLPTTAVFPVAVPSDTLVKRGLEMWRSLPITSQYTELLTAKACAGVELARIVPDVKRNAANEALPAQKEVRLVLMLPMSSIRKTAGMSLYSETNLAHVQDRFSGIKD